jgi:tRNA-2-methylthio-N6-dimethylallyladenosine synthase
MERRLYIRTFGCQMNVHDSDRIAELMNRAGWSLADDASAADVLLINSCSVREKAWHKAISEAGRLRRRKTEHAGAVVGIVGCVAEQEGDRIFELVPEIDLVLGPDNYRNLPELVEEVIENRRPRVAIGFDSGRPEDFPEAQAGIADRPVVSYVTVAKGCEERCAYCIVPIVRGPERSRPAVDIRREVETLVGDGVMEVMLLGQKVNAYRHGDTDFTALIDDVDRVPGLERLRFTSPHPRFVTPELAARFGRLRTLCESIHLPLQAGSDAVLARMERRYDSAEYLEAVDLLRSSCPDIAIYTDLIVGFPGETAAEFDETLKMLETVGFCGAFSFKYSPRPGTRAAELPDDVPPEEKSRRLAAVHEVVGEIERTWRAGFVGRTLEVLVEGRGRLPRQLSGRARNNQIVNFTSVKNVTLEELRGRVVDVAITDAHPHSMAGRLVEA